MRHKFYMTLFFILGLCLSTAIFAQEQKVARINDKNGYTNVRSGKGKEFPIIATLDSSDLFECERSNNEWMKILALTKFDVSNVEGYVHRSRIEFLADIDKEEKKELFEKTFTTYQELVRHWHQLDDSKNYTKAQVAVFEVGHYSNAIYSSVLSILPAYIKQTKDTTTLQLFFSTMWIDSGSANEIPSFTIGECYVYQPDFVIGQIKLLTDKEQRAYLFDAIEHGIDFYFDYHEEKVLEQRKKLEEKLNNARKNIL